MSGPYVIVEERRTPKLQSRAECMAVALLALYWIERGGRLIEEALGRCAAAKNQAPPVGAEHEEN